MVRYPICELGEGFQMGDGSVDGFVPPAPSTIFVQLRFHPVSELPGFCRGPVDSLLTAGCLL